MFTSYFSNSKIKNGVSISSRNPDGFKGFWYKKLSPPIPLIRSYIKGEINAREYTKRFKKEVLDLLDARETYQEIVNLFGEDCILLCYEKPGKFCHRKLVSKWFKDNIGVKITELK